MLRRMAKLADCGTLDAVKHPRQHGLCRLPDDAKDHGGDDKADDRVGKRVSQPHAKRAKDDRQAGEAVGSRMITIGDQGRAVDLPSDADAKHGYRLVAQKTDHASGGKPAELRNRAGVDDAVDGLVAGD